MKSLVSAVLTVLVQMTRREVSTTDCGLSTRIDMQRRPWIAGDTD